MIHFVNHDNEADGMHSIYDTDDLQAAFRGFVRDEWNEDIIVAIAVWHGNFLIAQVLPVYNAKAGVYEPRLYPIPPPRSPVITEPSP